MSSCKHFLQPGDGTLEIHHSWQEVGWTLIYNSTFWNPKSVLSCCRRCKVFFSSGGSEQLIWWWLSVFSVEAKDCWCWCWWISSVALLQQHWKPFKAETSLLPQITAAPPCVSGDLWWPLFFPLQPCKKWRRPSVSVTINILIFYRHCQAQEQSDQTILHSFFLHFYSFLLSILSFSDLRFWWTRWSKGTLLHCSGSTKIFSSFQLYDDFLFSFLLFLNRTAGWMLGLNNSQFHSMTKQLTLFLMFWFCTKHVIKCSVNKLMLIWPWRFVFAVHVFQMYYCWFIPCVR